MTPLRAAYALALLFAPVTAWAAPDPAPLLPPATPPAEAFPARHAGQNAALFHQQIPRRRRRQAPHPRRNRVRRLPFPRPLPQPRRRRVRPRRARAGLPRQRLPDRPRLRPAPAAVIHHPPPGRARPGRAPHRQRLALLLHRRNQARGPLARGRQLAQLQPGHPRPRRAQPGRRPPHHPHGHARRHPRHRRRRPRRQGHLPPPRQPRAQTTATAPTPRPSASTAPSSTTTSGSSATKSASASSSRRKTSPPRTYSKPRK